MYVPCRKSIRIIVKAECCNCYFNLGTKVFTIEITIPAFTSFKKNSYLSRTRFGVQPAKIRGTEVGNYD